MRNSEESVHGDGNRASGRTYRQLASLLPGDVYLVNSQSMMYHARQILREHFGGKKIEILIMSNLDCSRPDKLRGLAKTVWIEVDHWLLPKLSDGLIRFIQVHNAWVPANGR